MAVMLELKNVSCGYDGVPVVKDISFTVGPGEVVSILGANGVGKTTLFKTVLSSLPPLGGSILLGGQENSRLTSRQRARLLGYVPQVHTPPFPYTVLQVVTTGRTAHLSIFSSPSEADNALATETLERLGIRHLADRVYTELSGGERQLVLIARALAQQPEILIMDEPTSNLDFGNQLRMLRLIRSLAAGGLSVLLTTHYPEHVLNCATKVVVLYGQGRFRVGAPAELITSETLSELYRVDAEVRRMESRGRRAAVCIPWIEEADT
jgi:iron complex transport system ATP-binding protein